MNFKKRKKHYFIARTFSLLVMILSAFSIFGVGFSSWLITADQDFDITRDLNIEVGAFVDRASLITYYDGNYTIPPICQDGFIIDETITYNFSLNFVFRLRVLNNPPNHGLEHFLEGKKSFTLKMRLKDEGALNLLSSGYMDNPAVVLQVKPENVSTYTTVSHSLFDNTSSGRINVNYPYQNNDILNYAYLDFVFTLNFQFAASHFGTSNNFYDTILDLENDPNIDKVIAIHHEMIIEV